MKRILRLLALILILASILTWVVTGANRGWTKTSFPVKISDPVTGIDGIEYQKRFMPGVDFLAAALIGAAFLAGISCFFRAPSSKFEQK
jgi:hypothetical protein